MNGNILPCLLLATASAISSIVADDPSQEIETCLSCHGDKEMSLTLPDGKSASLFVDRAQLSASIHGKDLRCTDCHAGMGDVPHPERKVKTLEAFRSGFRDACKACHFDTYTQSLDGVHYKQLAKGNGSAPWCTDCHGSHDVARAATPRTRISETCAACHQEVAETYSELRAHVLDAAKVGMELSRFKGLGEMNPEQLWETTMDPAKRLLIRVDLEDAHGADSVFSMLMGDAVEPRRLFIEQNAKDVKFLDV